MSYWHLFGGPIEWPVIVNGKHTHDALGVADGLVGPVDRPPIEDDYLDDETGERYEHVASWNREPTREQMDAAMRERWPEHMPPGPPLLEIRRDDESRIWTMTKPSTSGGA